MRQQEPSVLTFHDVSRRVVFRLFVAHWFRLLGRSAVPVYAAAAIVAGCAWHFGVVWMDTFWALGLVLAWLAATCAWAGFRRPSAEAALAYWDEGAGRDEMFISAFCFESRRHPEAGEQLHLDRAARQLRRDVSGLARDLPTPLAHRAWLLPLAFVGLVGLLLVPPSPADEPRVDQAARARAQEVAQTLAGQTKLVDKDKGLTPDEEEQLKKLEKSVKETTEKLRKLDDQTHRSVLAELEEKAHQAEKLAEAMQRVGEDELSSKMLEELARHADTTDFASAMQAKNLQKGSEEALKLSTRLEHKDLSLEEQKRVEHALDKALEVATKADKQGLVGKHLKQAHQGLRKNKPKDAGRQLQKLSKQLAQARQRQLAKQRLQRLAQQLRNSGQRIFGRNPSKIRRLTKNNQSGLQQLGAQQLQALKNMSLQQRLGAMQQGQLGRATIGAKLAAGQNLPKAGMQVPIPGSNAPPAPGMGPAPMPGSGQTPIPGTNPPGPGPGAAGPGTPGPGNVPGTPGPGPGAAGPGGGHGPAVPVPGAPGPGAGDGGHFAGHGSAPYGNKKTNPLNPTGTGVVDAAVSGEGPSAVRSIERGMHREDTLRNSRDLAIEFIKTEEEALAAEPLPLSRRQQVLRYFTALRRQLVEHEPPEQSNP